MPECLSWDKSIQIRRGDAAVIIAPANYGQYASTQIETESIFGQKSKKIVYKDVFGEGMDLSCALTSFGVNFEIEFKERPTHNTIQINLLLPNWVPDTGCSDYILFRDSSEQGEVKAILESPLIADENQKWSYSNSVHLINKNETTGVYTVEYTIDDAFLENNETKYPVKANHSIGLYVAKQPDTTACQSAEEEPGSYLSPYMLMGNSTSRGEAKFNNFTFSILKEKISCIIKGE